MIPARHSKWPKRLATHSQSFGRLRDREAERLKKKNVDNLSRESHPREWVDCSHPAYTEEAALLSSFSLLLLTPCARREKEKRRRIRVRPLGRLNVNNPHTAVWGITFSKSTHRGSRRCIALTSPSTARTGAGRGALSLARTHTRAQSAEARCRPFP